MGRGERGDGYESGSWLILVGFWSGFGRVLVRFL